MGAQKKKFVKDITENCEVEDLFLVRSKNNGITKNGKPYIALVLGDATGEVKARIWDNAEKLGAAFQEGDLVKIKAFSILYQGALQLNVSDIVALGEGVDVSGFLPSSQRDIETTFVQLVGLIDEVQNEHLKQLLQIVFSDEALVSAFKKAPAAKALHHDYIGGLLDHTYMVACLVLAVQQYYPKVNRDLALAGALLHDIGKTQELSYATSFDYSDRGRLLGHIVIGDEIVREKIALLPDFPIDLAMVLRHILLSHHGQYEFGSPKRPKTLEALLVGYLDDLDAKLYGFTRAITHEKSSREGWTTYNKLFDRYLYSGLVIDPDDNAKERKERGNLHDE